jgi:FMN phosphatase YigB (HAD superfamily)
MSKIINTPQLIAFDVDGCVLNFVEGFKLWMQQHHGRITERGEDHVRGYPTFVQDLYPDFNPKPLHEILDDYFEHPIYAQMQPFPHAVEAVSQIKADYLTEAGACLLFDDHPEQIEAAEAKGIKAIMVTRA